MLELLKLPDYFVFVRNIEAGEFAVEQNVVLSVEHHFEVVTEALRGVAEMHVSFNK